MNPRTWVTADFATAAMMNTEVRDLLNLALLPPRAMVERRVVNFSVPHNALVTIGWNWLTYNDGGMYTSGANRLTAVKPGLHVFSWWADSEPSSFTRFLMYLIKMPGTLPIARFETSQANATWLSGACYGEVRLAVGEYVEAQVLQTNASSAARNLLADRCGFTGRWVGN